MFGWLTKLCILSYLASCPTISPSFTYLFAIILIAQRNPDYFYIAKTTLPKAPLPNSFNILNFYMPKTSLSIKALPLCRLVSDKKEGIFKKSLSECFLISLILGISN